MTVPAGSAILPSPRTSADRRSSTLWPSGRPGRRPYVTAGYLLLLLVTTLVLRSSSASVADALLDASSTDVWHLAHDPLQVLATSALWLPNQQWWYYAAIFVCFMAPLERRVGVRWMVLVFLSGHVLATLMTELPIGGAIWLGWLPLSAARRTDVGVSYGMFAVVGAYAGLLPATRRRLVTLAAAALVAVPLVGNHDMTSIGHVLSLLIGISWWPALRRRCRPWAKSQPTPRRTPAVAQVVGAA
jgi:hypothetical protein